MIDIIKKAKILYEEIGGIIGYQGRIIFLGLIAELEKSDEARPGWCPICHERILNKVKAENAELKKKLAAVCYEHHKETTDQADGPDEGDDHSWEYGDQ